METFQTDKLEKVMETLWADKHIRESNGNTLWADRHIRESNGNTWGRQTR